MSDLPGHDHDPDPAALDELRRAFGEDATRPTEPTPVVRPETEPSEPADSSEPAEPSDPAALGEEETVVHEHEPTPPGLAESEPASGAEPEPDRATGASSEPATPTIIRIDGYSGSSPIEPAEPATERTDAASVADRSPSGDDGDVIAISVDDDLPDPVYVEGNLDRNGGGTIVFIENDESGDTMGPESGRETRRGIEPRMRERRVAVKRAQGRRRLKRALLIVGVVVIVVGGLAVLGSPLFAVRHDDVRVFGVVYSRGEQFDAVIDDAVGTPVLRVDTTRLEDELEAIPWIEQARVTTDFPHGLTIDVRERAAVATYRGPDGRFRVLDREGRVLDVIDDGYPYAYVLIGGPDAADLDAGDFAPRGYAAAAELAKNLTSSVRGHVVRIDVLADGSRLTLELDDGSTVYFGEARDLLAKLVRLEAVFAGDDEREPGLIDVSTADVTR